MEKLKRINKDIDLKKILNNNIIQFIINILFGISTASLTIILIEAKYSNIYLNIILPILSFIIIQIITFKFKFLNKTFDNLKKIQLLISIILSQVIIYNTYNNMIGYSVLHFEKIFTILAIPSIIIFLYWFYDKFIYYIKKYFNSMDKIEKVFLIISSSIIVISICIIYNTTDVFYYANVPKDKYNYTIKYDENSSQDDELLKSTLSMLYDIRYDVIYTSDSPLLIQGDVYTNIVDKENDIRQPLFGVFSIPFSIVPKAISMMLPIITNLYPTLLGIVQAILVLISFTLLARLMKLKGITKIVFLLTLMFLYPTLLFIFNLEQYIMAVFYLILFVYMSVNNIKDKDIAYIMATGSMLTSGILFPLLGEKNNIKKSIKNIFLTFIKCMAILIISARIILISPQGMNDQMRLISTYSNNDSEQRSETNNLAMYTNFINNNIYYTDFAVKDFTTTSKLIVKGDIKFNINTKLPSIKQIDTDKINIMGIAIGIIAILGFIFNRKDKFCRICFGWIIFSFILLFVLGWGTYENGLILYTFYFSWAFICLIYKFIEKILSKLPKIKNIIYFLILSSIMIINIYGIHKVILFGIENYRC